MFPGAVIVNTFQVTKWSWVPADHTPQLSGEGTID